MRDFSGSKAVEPARLGPAITTERSRKARTHLLVLATMAAVLDGSVHATFAYQNTPRAAGMGYLCDAVVLIGCALALWTRARTAQGVVRIRWWLVAGGALAEGLGYLPSFAEGFLNYGAARQFQTACFNASEALFLLAVLLFFAGVTRPVVIVDVLQTLVFVVLRFNLAYSPYTRDHFTHIHLVVGQLVAATLFVVAAVGRLGAASREEVKLLRTLSWFFGLRLIAFLAADQVSYIWLHHRDCSEWDVVGTTLFAGFALYLLYSDDAAQGEAAEAAALRPSLAVRSLMPSLLALVNLMLGLFLLRISMPLAAVAIAVTVVSYVVRTVLLHAQAARERAELQSRNEQLEGLAIRDPLTGIGNRRSLAGVYKQLQSVAGESGLSLLLMDIDSFKKANDCHGHLFGDEVLVALGRELESLAAGMTGSHCARLGGDEFALLLPGATAEEASTLAERLRARFGEHRFRAGEMDKGRVSLSIGVAWQGAARELPLETLVCSADEALYRAKLLGRDRVEMAEARDPEDGGAGMELHFELQHTGG